MANSTFMNQAQSVIEAKFFLSRFNKKSYPDKNIVFYFATYVSSIGLYIFNKIVKKKSNFFKNFNMIFKDVLYTYNYTDNELFFSNRIIKDYDRIFLTWASAASFKKDGSFHDKYLNINTSKFSKTLIIAIYKDKKLPKKIDTNIIIFQTKSKKIGILNIVKNILINLNLFFSNYDYFLAKISSHNFFSKELMNKTKFFLNKKIKSFLTPYEGQPFQNEFIKHLKRLNKDIKCVGYIHSPPIPIPSNFIFRNCSPDKVVLNGRDQVYCFNKYLGWPKSKIKLLPSFRFFKIKKFNKKIIFLPYHINNLTKIIHSIDYLIKKKFIDPKKYTIKSHPAIKSRNSDKIINYFNNIKINNKISKKIKNKFLIFIGNSGGIIEYLERGYEVIHICDDNFYDLYSNELWPSIISTKVYDGIYIYRVKKKGNLINFGDAKKHNIKKILNIAC